MSITMDSSLLYQTMNSGITGNSAKVDSLQKTLEKAGEGTAEDQELLEACKSFETYFTEQIFKEMKKTVHSSDDEGEYTQYFGDTMMEEYAKSVTESGTLGIAQMLFDSMKRNS